MRSAEFLQAAIDVQTARAAEYDQPQGERSMGRTVQAFNAITGRDLSEAEGWLLLQVLKDVRQWSATGYHHDSALDGVAYSALKAEALSTAEELERKWGRRVPEGDVKYGLEKALAEAPFNGADVSQWRTGDVVEYLGADGTYYHRGGLYNVTQLGPLTVRLTDDTGDLQHPWDYPSAAKEFLWASRP